MIEQVGKETADEDGASDNAEGDLLDKITPLAFTQMIMKN